MMNDDDDGDDDDDDDDDDDLMNILGHSDYTFCNALND